MRFLLRTYEGKQSKKGKIVKKKEFESPLKARMSSLAQKAVYYEIVDLEDKRVIEVKIEEGD